MSNPTPGATPTRRRALGFSAAAILAGLAAPVLASTKTEPDAAVIALCRRIVAIEGEMQAIYGLSYAKERKATSLHPQTR